MYRIAALLLIMVLIAWLTRGVVLDAVDRYYGVSRLSSSRRFRSNLNASLFSLGLLVLFILEMVSR